MYSEMLLYTAGLFFVTVVLHHFIYRRSPKSGKSTSRANIDHGRLVGACFGDKAKAIRLADYEQSRAPGIDRAEAIKRALERLQEDRSR
ncbi:MAG: hypothetical protein Q8R69_18785 [Telluria sp.]|nr:hypothetical protein [Telluria sp.]